MSAADDTPISAAEARALFADLFDIPVLVLAISGGPDSTALMWLAARWRKALKHGPKLIAVTVDHGLRPEAKREAAAVKKLAGSLGIEHHTLRWMGAKPKTGLQEAARNARYRLLGEAVDKTGAQHVLTAHTLDDQAETVLIRMTRGSGVSGLAAMAAHTQLDSIAIVRPLLDIPKARLVATLRAARIAYADDPSNRDPRFTRVRMRGSMAALAGEGLSAGRLATLARRIRRADAAIEAVVDQTAAGLAAEPWSEQGPIKFAAGTFFGLPDEVALRLLGRAIATTGDEGPVELGKLEALYDALPESSHGVRFRRTLAGAVVTLDGDHVRVERAPARRSRAPKRP